MVDMPKNHIQYPFATNFERSRQGSAASSVPSGPVSTSKLPVIPSATPPPGESNWLVPVNRKQDRGGVYSKSGLDPDESDGRMHVLETRLGVTEKSNRALMEEVLRLHSELRVNVRKNEENIKEDRMSRHQLEGSLQIVNDLINKLSSRIKTTEDKIVEERSALSSLVSHTKGVEQAVLSSQQTLAIKKDSQGSK
ncbi:uncharacterized protein LOC106013328 [Aplysia californica]|uniref:Uncharacterized protein LOC106013328 n=1 Tax=Aplysia californica TaxID=6500 RepID=A0ABM1AAV9_APLCA|nr:uncharacterized protein LOC106013328 [Aplysia californica]